MYRPLDTNLKVRISLWTSKILSVMDHVLDTNSSELWTQPDRSERTLMWTHQTFLYMDFCADTTGSLHMAYELDTKNNRYMDTGMDTEKTTQWLTALDTDLFGRYGRDGI